MPCRLHSALRAILLSFSLLLGSAALLSTPALAKPDAVPDWVRAAATQNLPAYSDRTNAVVLLDDTTYTVGADGRAIERRRRAVKILAARPR